MLEPKRIFLWFFLPLSNRRLQNAQEACRTSILLPTIMSQKSFDPIHIAGRKTCRLSKKNKTVYHDRLYKSKKSYFNIMWIPYKKKKKLPIISDRKTTHDARLHLSTSSRKYTNAMPTTFSATNRVNSCSELCTLNIINT